MTAFIRIVALFLPLFGSLPAAQAEMVPGATIAAVSDARRIDAILRQSESDMDLGRIKLTIDHMIDPTVDVEAGVKQIDDMAMEVRATLRGFPPSGARLEALRTYLYEKGPWNSYRSFDYDFDDPFGKNIRNKLISSYLASRKGNCVTMTLLFVIVGQRLGLDVTIATAPSHLFVKYTDPENGATYNLEAANGGKPARDVWIRQNNPMTDQAIANGIYMRRLSKRETAAVMATTLTEYLAGRRQHEKVIALSDVVLKHYPKDATSMIWKGSAYGRLATKHFIKKYQSPNQIPPEERNYFRYLEKQNQAWFAKAEALGWREPDPDYEAKYLQTVIRAKSTQ